ncbi:ARID DNA-binding domain-containing protein [Tanacetum coccineum]
MLMKEVKENEAYNASRVSANTSTQKEKRARCYICKERGHVFWKCPNKQKKALFKKQKGIMKPTFKKVAEKVEKLKYKFEMIGKEETEKKFIFSYGIGDIIMEAKEGNFVIPNVHYTPEVTLNVLSYDLLEEQGYVVKISNNKCNIQYMFGGKGKGKAHEGSYTDNDGLEHVITEHNKFLDKYFKSIEPKDEGSCVKGLEELKWDRNKSLDESFLRSLELVKNFVIIKGMADLKMYKVIVHDYIDNKYLSLNGTLYAMKVNTFPRFLSFLELIKIDKLVYENWEVLRGKFMELLEWFYIDIMVDIWTYTQTTNLTNIAHLIRMAQEDQDADNWSSMDKGNHMVFYAKKSVVNRGITLDGTPRKKSSIARDDFNKESQQVKQQ